MRDPGDERVIVEHIDDVRRCSTALRGDFVGDSVGALQLAIDDGDMCSLCRDQPDSRLADPEATTEYKDALAFESQIHRRSPSHCIAHMQ